MDISGKSLTYMYKKRVSNWSILRK